MLYVFQMDLGQMLTFDMSLLMDNVSRLQVEIARKTGISTEKQILLVSGGHSLKPEHKVLAYGAGADTNPVFLFSKAAIENQEAPLVKSIGTSKDVLNSLKERITEALSVKTSCEAVAIRARLASQISDSANKVLSFCNNEFREQHLQYQGWGAVVANLEELAQALQNTEVKFSKTFNVFLPNRENHVKRLNNFEESLQLLERVPLLEVLRPDGSCIVNSAATTATTDTTSLTSMSDSRAKSENRITPPHTLLDWITRQGHGQSIEHLKHKCLEDLSHFNEEMFEKCHVQVQDLLTLMSTDPHQMKELVGIERRLSDLEKRLNEAKRLAKQQSDLSQALSNHQQKLQKVSDMSVLSDLCDSHHPQFRQMFESQQRILALQTNFRNSKQEMSSNIHQRLGWVMHIETQISKLDSELIFHLKTLKNLESNLELLAQIKNSSVAYAEMVVEAARRKKFSRKFSDWAGSLVEDSSSLYQQETDRRRRFTEKVGDHFLLHTLFKGFEDMPPSFATKSPRIFDESLPEITTDDISFLRNSLPELEESLCVSIETDDFISRSAMRPQRLVTSLSTSTSPIQPAPCIIVKATEAPAASFTVPELQESRLSEYHPAMSCLTMSLQQTGESPTPKPQTREDPSQVKTSVKENTQSGEVESSSERSSSSVRKDLAKVSTDSTSPPSSMEFATADFYFEDSMSSSGPANANKEKDAIFAGYDKEVRIALSEKDKIIDKLRKCLKEKDEELDKFYQLGNSPSDPSVSTLVELNNKCEISQESHLTQEVKGGDMARELESKTSLLEDEQRVRLEQVSVITELEVRIAEFKDQILVSDNEIKDKSKQIKNLNERVASLEAELNDSLKLNEDTKVTELKELEQLQDVVYTHFSSQLSQMVDSYEYQGGQFNFKSQGSYLTMFQTFVDKIETLISDILNSFKESAENLNSKASKLENDLTEVKRDGSEKLAALQKSMDRLVKEKEEVEKDLVLRLKQQEEDLKAAIKDLETKHSLELEIEVDRQRAELLQKLENADKNVETLTNMNSNMAAEIEDLKVAARLEKQELERLKREELETLEKQKSAEQETLKASMTSDLQERVRKGNLEIEDLKVQFQTMQKELLEEKEAAVLSVRESLATQHQEHLELELETLRQQLSGEHEESTKLQLATLTERLTQQLEADSNRQLAELREKLTVESQTATDRQLAGLREDLIKDHSLEMERALTTLTEKLQEENSLAVQQAVADNERQIAEKLSLEKDDALDVQRKSLEQEFESCVKEQLDCLRQALEKEHDEAREKENMNTKEEMEAERHRALEELRENLEKQNWELVEQKQLEYANKLTELKNHFENERETLQSEVNKYRNQAMMNSGTQTDLLAEVISLTGSVSDGSEEMNKQSPVSPTEEVESSSTENLRLAQAEIESLKQEIENLKHVHEQVEKRRSFSQTSNSDSESSKTLVASHSSAMEASFMLMDKDQMHSIEADTLRLKDQKIVQLEKKIMEMSVSSVTDKENVQKEKDKVVVAIKSCERGDLVLLCLDEKHNQYVVFTVGTNLHFLHSDSLEQLGLKTGESPSRKAWILAEVVEKEFCLAKKPNNRFRVPQGTCFYRVKCRPWKSDGETFKHEKDGGKHSKKSEQTGRSKSKQVDDK